MVLRLMAVWFKLVQERNWFKMKVPAEQQPQFKKRNTSLNRELGRLWFHYGSKLRSKRSFHSSGDFFKGVCVPTYRAWGAADAMGRVRIRLKSVPPKTRRFYGFWRRLNGSKVECREIKVGTFGQSLSSVPQLGIQKKTKTGRSRIWVINRGFTAEKPD